ncbi:hypothetical protein [Aquamicrobium terrae]
MIAHFAQPLTLQSFGLTKMTIINVREFGLTVNTENMEEIDTISIIICASKTGLAILVRPRLPTSQYVAEGQEQEG